MAHEYGTRGNGRIDLGFGGLTAALGDHIGHYYQNETECQSLAVGYFARVYRRSGGGRFTSADYWIKHFMQRRVARGASVNVGGKVHAG